MESQSVRGGDRIDESKETKAWLRFLDSEEVLSTGEAELDQVGGVPTVLTIEREVTGVWLVRIVSLCKRAANHILASKQGGLQ